MSWFTSGAPALWPLIVSVAVLLFLAGYSWRRRSVPGALPFAAACVFTMLWGVGTILELAAATFAAKVFWYKFQYVWILPALTAILCFVLDYADPGRWLTRRILTLLFVPCLLALVLALTNDLHHLTWQGFALDGSVHAQQGSGYWLLLGYAYLVGLINVAVFLWLFVRSPQHRWPVALMLAGQMAGRAVFLLDIAHVSIAAPDPIFLAFVFPFATYAVALFRFRIFDPIPVARQMVLEQMQEGMIVLDPHSRIVDLNPMAEQILSQPVKRLQGRPVEEVLPGWAGRGAGPVDQRSAQAETSLGTGGSMRFYTLHISPLKDGRGVLLGHLLLLHDVTGQKRAQAQLLEQQRMVATLQERERLARELHDSFGQVMGYVSMQAQAIYKRVRDGDVATAETQLARLAEVAQETHNDVRESILGLKTYPVEGWSFFAALQHHFDCYREQYGIGIEFSLPPGIGEQSFDPDTSVQLLRVIQEALANARKHGQAGCVRVTFDRQGGDRARILIADDGGGFSAGRLAEGAGSHFGLAFMRERMAEIGGQLSIESRPGAGTQVALTVPILEEGNP